jgi:hypothetical protein
MGYQSSPTAYVAGFIYLGFAILQMYVLLPLLVCPNCVYYALPDSRCISGLNIVSRRMAERGELQSFVNRGQGFFCHNNLYMVSLLIPIIGLIPALVLHFSPWLLLLFFGLIVLLLYRVFVIFPKVACVHCRAKHICPNAQSMGIGRSDADPA